MRVMQAAQFTLFCQAVASSKAYASWDLNLPQGVTSVSHAIYFLHMTILWICVAIGVVVFGFIFYAVTHYRKSQGAKSQPFHEHVWLELTWTIIPFVILVVMAVPATRVLVNMSDTARPDLTIKVTGYQWKWQYDYLDQHVKFFSQSTTPYNQIHGLAPKGEHYLREVDHPLVLPIHKKIRFIFTSNDVIHSWWVEYLGVKHDAVPGFITESWARINRPGVYYGQCAELCGINHAYMPIVVIAMAEKDFDQWVQKQKQPVSSDAAPSIVSAKPVVKSQTVVVEKKAETAPALAAAAAKPLTKEEQMKIGEQVYLGTCAMCHQPDGSGMPPTFPAIKGGKVSTGALAPHIDIVLHGKQGTAMQPFGEQLKDEEIAAVITYERNAFGNNKGDVVQPADIAAARKK